MPELYCMEPEADSVTKICMPAFLPTIQAKTQTKEPDGTQWSAVKRYLQKNDLSDDVTTRTIATTAPYTVSSSLDSQNQLTSVAVLEKTILPRGASRVSTQKYKKRKTAKHKTRYRPTDNKKMKVSMYGGTTRELSTKKVTSATTNRSSRSYHSCTAPQEDLIMHFSRISMKHVQANLNNNRLSILPNIS